MARCEQLVGHDGVELAIPNRRANCTKSEDNDRITKVRSTESWPDDRAFLVSRQSDGEHGFDHAERYGAMCEATEA